MVQPDISVTLIRADDLLVLTVEGSTSRSARGPPARRSSASILTPTRARAPGATSSGVAP
jgi:hypothetical protein